MFDIGWSELVVIGVVALIAIGPKELPGVLRSLGTWMGKVRRMASEFQDQFREAMREAEVADLKRQFDEASAKATAGFTNPLETAQKEVEEAFASADPSKIMTSDPGAIEPPANPPAVSPESPAVPEPTAAAVEAPVVPANPSKPRPADNKPADTNPADTKPGGNA
jgi:sec-independent protein translocase protein TatB